MSEVTNIAVAGVGGQGIILASDIIAEAAVRSGCEVKKNEVHGMAQRGGSVVSEIRFGPRVRSPIIPDGEVDVLIALELLEGLRHAHRLRADGLLIANELRVSPAVRPPGAPPYPRDVLARLRRAAANSITMSAAKLAARAGNVRAANTVLLGTLSRHVDIPLEAWQDALQACLRPALVDVNVRAFELGRRRRGGPRTG